MDLVPGTVVERYTVEARLGSGGMAVVYRVRHNQLGTLHAMKVLALPAPGVRKRFLNEGRLQGSLRHTNIVAVTDAVDIDGWPALVMEYVSGPTLAEVLAGPRLSFDRADELGRGILLGVEAAHRRGIVHRDLKPANVLLSLENGGAIPKIADFGLAKALGGEAGEGQTRAGTTMGTPAYMAPEQVRDARSVDHRADLFSLGAVLYELVTGTRAFHGADTFELLKAVATAETRPPEELVEGLPERFRAAIAAALVADPGRRVASCTDLLGLWTGDPTRSWERGTWGEAPVAAPPPPATNQDGETTYLLRTAVPEPVAIGGQHFDTVLVEAGRFAIGDDREVVLTRPLIVAVAPFSSSLAAALGSGTASKAPATGLAWEAAIDLCNRLSERTGLPPAYSFGDWRPRRTLSVDDVGRALYDHGFAWERIGPILKAFGADALAVLQHAPERLAEVEGIGPKTAKRLGDGWDRWWQFTREVTPTGAGGWRLPTEAEWEQVRRAAPRAEIWEWVWDADPRPPWQPQPEPLRAGSFTDPPGLATGARRIVRRWADRAARVPETRAPDVGFRVVRTPG